MEHLPPEALVRDATREPLDQFVEQMGLIAQSENLPRIAGRMIGLFLVEGRTYGLKELSERLQVSRASVSTNARLLSQVGLLERVAIPGDRQDYYRLAPEPYSRILGGMVERMNNAHDAIVRAEQSFPAEREDARRRLRDFAAFYRAAADNVDGLIARFSGR
jgi:DNA-binding transcriptional regulator GbsR (MarR family)